MFANTQLYKLYLKTSKYNLLNSNKKYLNYVLVLKNNYEKSMKKIGRCKII